MVPTVVMDAEDGKIVNVNDVSDVSVDYFVPGIQNPSYVLEDRSYIQVCVIFLVLVQMVANKSVEKDFYPPMVGTADGSVFPAKN